MRDINYILKRVIIGFLIGSLLIIFKMNIAHAEAIEFDVKVSGYSITSKSNSVWVQGNYANIVIDYQGYADPLPEPTDYWQVSIAICRYNASSGVDVIEGWAGSPSVDNTGYVCSFPNSNLTGNVSIITYNASGAGSYNRVYLRVYQSNSSDYSLLGWSVSHDGALQAKDFGYLPDITQINQNNTIISNQNAQTQILNNVVSAVNNSSQFLQTLIGRVQNLEDTMKDDSIEENNSQFSEFESYMASNGVITNLITMPVTLFTRVLNTIDGSCTTYNLGQLYGTDLTLPCINISNYLGSTLWGVIDVIISGVLIYAISRHFVKVFNKMSSLEESDVIDD